MSSNVNVTEKQAGTFNILTQNRFSVLQELDDDNTFEC